MKTLAMLLLAAQTVTWAPLGHWTGDGSRDTESFTTTQREWRIRWTQTSKTPIRSFSLTVVNAASNAPVATAGSSTDGETFVRTAPGQYYLKISSANTQWSITAEERH